MAYDVKLAARIREYLTNIKGLKIEEKKMFKGLSFMVNDKMCVNVSGRNLMCRFHPSLQQEVENRNGFETMIMRGKILEGYCYVTPDGYKATKDFEYWMRLCLDFNPIAKSSKKK